jgi:hypothetical protein
VSTDVLTGLCAAFWVGPSLWRLGAWARHAWRSPAYRPHAIPAPALADEDTVPIPLPVDAHAATTPTVSACLCDPPGCGARPCLTYTKEHAYR